MVKISCNFLYLFIANGGTKQVPFGNVYSLAGGFFVALCGLLDNCLVAVYVILHNLFM